jgi:hypothetical protein
MDFQKQWQDGVSRVSCVFQALSEPELATLRTLSLVMIEQKEAMQALVAQVDAASHCAGCGGACCVRGKYHFSAADLLVFLSTGAPLFAPLFDNGLCCYLGAQGCLMAPAYRPFNCITFNCELIEDRLPEQDLARFYALERELRRTYAEIRSLFPGGAMDGALLKGPVIPVA